MTKQEKIREIVKKYLRPNLKYEDESLIDGVVYVLLDKLNSQDVVIKVWTDYHNYKLEPLI